MQLVGVFEMPQKRLLGFKGLKLMSGLFSESVKSTFTSSIIKCLPFVAGLVVLRDWLLLVVPSENEKLTLLKLMSGIVLT
jgi:hypothetical protein